MYQISGSGQKTTQPISQQIVIKAQELKVNTGCVCCLPINKVVSGADQLQSHWGSNFCATNGCCGYVGNGPASGATAIGTGVGAGIGAAIGTGVGAAIGGGVGIIGSGFLACYTSKTCCCSKEVTIADAAVMYQPVTTQPQATPYASLQQQPPAPSTPNQGAILTISGSHYPKGCPISHQPTGCGSSRVMMLNAGSHQTTVQFHCQTKQANDGGGVTQFATVKFANGYTQKDVNEAQNQAQRMINNRLGSGRCIGFEDGAGRRAVGQGQSHSSGRGSHHSRGKR